MALSGLYKETGMLLATIRLMTLVFWKHPEKLREPVSQGEVPAKSDNPCTII